MVTLRLNDLVLEDGVTHMATDWEVSETLSFNKVVLRSIENKLNKTTMVFNGQLDTDKKWYARARCLLSTGYTVWSNVDIFIPKKLNDLDINESMPSKVARPLIRSTSDLYDHESLYFTLIAEGFDVIGNGTHVATTWIIEDYDGNVIWQRIFDTVNLKSVLVNDILLQAGQVYKIKAAFHSSSYDVSPFGAKTIHVTKDKTMKLDVEQTTVSSTGDTEFRVVTTTPYDYLIWNLYAIEHSSFVKVFSKQSSGLSFSIDGTRLKKGSMYLLQIKNNTKHTGITRHLQVV